MKTIITGASGHIGTALLKELKSRGISATAFVLPNEDVSHISSLCDGILRGDVRNLDNLVEAFAGAENIIHLAGIISIGNENKKLVTAVNVQGTQNVVEAAKIVGAKNLLYTGSVHAIPVKKKQILSEPERFYPKKVVGHYAKTKAEALNIVLDANCAQLRTVAALPSGVVGPFAYRESNIGALISSLANGSLRANVCGGYDYVDARDVAFGIAELLQHGKGGESYILSGGYLSVKRMLGAICLALDIKPPSICLPAWLAIAVSPFAELYYAISKRKPVFTRYSLYTIASSNKFSHKKATDLFGYKPRKIETALLDEVVFMQSQLGLKTTKRLRLNSSKVQPL